MRQLFFAIYFDCHTSNHHHWHRTKSSEESRGRGGSPRSFLQLSAPRSAQVSEPMAGMFCWDHAVVKGKLAWLMPLSSVPAAAGGRLQ
jgi:hypothetical protein